MKITLKQDAYNSVEIKLSSAKLESLLDMIGEDQIAEIAVTFKKPAEADNEIQN